MICVAFKIEIGKSMANNLLQFRSVIKQSSKKVCIGNSNMCSKMILDPFVVLKYLYILPLFHKQNRKKVFKNDFGSFCCIFK